MNENNLGLNKSLRLAIVTNMPAPYRIPIFQQLTQHYGNENFKVFFCTVKEGNRDWVLDLKGFDYEYLKNKTLTWKKRFIHFNFDVFSPLRKFNPDVIITTGFNPTFIFAFGYAMFYKKIHIPMTDGTLESEKTLGVIHRIVRRVIYAHSNAFIGASLGSFCLYDSYGINRASVFISHLCANNSEFHPLDSGKQTFDLMFSGRFSPEKNPLFAIEVAVGVAKLLKRKVSLIMLGAGPLLEEAKLYATTKEDFVEVIFLGFLQQDVLPQVYCSAKVFLFPSSWDPWGVVANEACAAGQAVLISPHAGAANDLIIHGENGYVLDLNLASWVAHASELLSNEELRFQLAMNGLSKVQAYNYESAANGIIDAVSSVYPLLEQS